MNYKGSTFRAIALFLVGGILGWQTNMAYVHGDFGTLIPHEETAQVDATEDANLDLGMFWNVWNTIKNDYVDFDSVKQDEQVYGAISGLVSALGDPYSEFMSPDETMEFDNNLNGKLEGIGAELVMKEDRLTILSPLKDSPAEQNGILPGDYIYMVDDKLTGDMTLSDAIMAIRGPAGTSVKLTIVREGAEDLIEKTITRQEINVPSVENEFLDSGGKKIAHLSIYQFGDDTVKEFEKAVQDTLLTSPDALILDLRMDGGGYLDASVDIIGEFFKDEVTAVSIKNRDGMTEVLTTKGAGRLADIPMVVLIDGGSASASEIVAGALQDYNRAKLIGVQSFGKGSVQELNNLSDGSSLRLTIAKWYTPLDKNVNEVGLTPDIVVEYPAPSADATEAEKENDPQLDAAVSYLVNL
ncbi:MAG: S41 family peptidase [Candidatus Gracilibacteria bacterium]|jgi:carboxyl-terminal processing protease